jgi:glycosyltransferase involved in cell wall biosynthesis
MRTPVVSVLIPVFNGERFLPECLESVLAQGFSECEILVSDDQSTDGSPAVIARYAARDPRIRSWRNPRNLGIGGNFNACLEAARGEFVKFVLQDDKFLGATALEQMVAAFRKDSAVALAACASQWIDSESRVLRERNCFGHSGVRDGKGVITQCLAENANLVGGPTLCLFRKSQAARGFDAQMKQLLDLELWFHLLEQGRFSFIAEPLCAFREHPGQQSELNRLSGAAADEHLSLIERYYARPWMKGAASPRMIFTQMYYLRKAYGLRAAPLISEMQKSMDSFQYATLWMRHKLTRPFRNGRHWLEKRAESLAVRSGRR